MTRRFKALREAKYLEQLAISNVGTTSVPSLAEVRKHWVNDPALEVIHGSIIQRPDGHWARSHIFIGDLGGKYLESEDILVQMRISEDEYASIADGHSLVTLFALAMDARRQPMAPNYIIKLLADANDVFNDITRHAMETSSHSVDPDVSRTHDAVRDARKDMGSP